MDRCRTAGRCLPAQQRQAVRAQGEDGRHGRAATRWVEDFSPDALKAIGALELLAAAALILPAALDIAPVLVPLAATGAVLLFVGAVITRLRRGEKATIVADLVYLAMAAFVAWGRFGPESFTG
jgi:VIT1/CCC1 family predicted Fe2+/Mn2+ transporter